jgi:hypothetical protein
MAGLESSLASLASVLVAGDLGSAGHMLSNWLGG